MAQDVVLTNGTPAIVWSLLPQRRRAANAASRANAAWGSVSSSPGAPTDSSRGVLTTCAGTRAITAHGRHAPQPGQP